MREFKIATISDTHRHHVELTADLEAVQADVLIHAGDADCTDEETTTTFLNWLNKVAKYFPGGALFTPGNHDTFFKDVSVDEIEEILSPKVQLVINSTVEVCGVKIWMSPCSVLTPGFDAFGFSEDVLDKVWSQIPLDTDVLVTHTPPKGIRDKWLGSMGLMDTVKKIKPKVHIFGHIHEGYGYEVKGGTTFVNACSLGANDKELSVPLVVSIGPDGVTVSQSPRVA